MTSNKKALSSASVPPAFGYYSSAILKGNLLFLAGQGPFDENQRLVGGDIAEQTHQTLRNIKNLLEDNGFTMDDVVRSTVFLSDIADWAVFNQIYGLYFTEPYPVRTVVGCRLNGMLVEIECTAMKD